MSKTYEIAFQIAGKLNASFGNSIKDASGKFGALQTRISKLQEIAGKTEQFAKLENSLKNSGAQYSILQSKVNQLSQESQKASAHTKSLQRKFSATQASIENYKTALISNRIELRNINANMRRLNLEMKSSKAPAEALRLQHEALAQKAMLLRKSIDSDTLAMHRARSSLKPMSEDLKAARAESSGFANQLRRATQITESFKQSTEKQKVALKALQNELKISGADTDAFRRKQALLEKQLRQSEKAARQHQKIQGMQEKVGKWKSGALGAAIGAGESGAVLSLPIKQAMGMESAMADVKKVVDFDSPDQFKTMKNDIVALSKVIPMTAEDLAKIVAAGGQSGIAKEDLVGFAESAAKMGVAFDISSEEAGEMMAKWRTAFKMSQPEVVELADKINFLGNNTAASAPKISDVVRRIGPLGEIGGVASGEIAALGASMVGTGVESEVAATGIKNMILGLVSGEGATKSQAGAFAQLGLDATEMAKRMQTDAKGAILDVLTRIQGLDKYQQASVLKDLFGSESLSAIAPLLGNLDNLKKNLELVADKSKYSGSMQAEFAARIETTEAKLQLAKNAAAALGTKIGDALLPWIQAGANEFAWIADQLSAFTDKFPNLTKWLTVGAGGAMLFILGMSALSYILLGVGYPILVVCKYLAKWGMLTRAQAALTRTLAAAQWLWNAAMSANPIGLVIAGIAALIAIGYALYTNWDTVKQFFVALWESPAASILFFLMGPVGWLIGAVVGILANWETVKQWFITLYEEPEKALSQFVEMIYNKFGAVVDWLGEKWNWLKGLFGTPIEANVQASASGKGEVQLYDSDGIDIGSNARGGIYGKGAFLTTFAEESPEAAIPLDGSPRAVSLWQQAGEMLGITPAIFGGSSSITATFAPQIHIAGTAEQGTVTKIQQVMQESLADFERKLASLQNQKARVSYA